jgi:hypothetical protein
MEKIFIRERINAVDYNNVNQCLLFTSSDADIEGGIVNVNLESDVAGWYQLTFDAPAFILKNGELIDNPILKHLFPLSKLKYTRITKTGDKEEELILYFIVQPEEDSRDENGIVLKSYTCIDYPRHNLSKAKNGITIGEDTLDEKRSMTPNNEVPNVDGKVLYVKADVQSRMNFNNYSELGGWLDALPGAFAYIPSENRAFRLVNTDPSKKDLNDESKFINWHELEVNSETGTFQTCIKDSDGNIIPEPVWSPEWGGYPLAPDPNKYDYGSIGINDIDPAIVQFYWDTVWFDPEKTMGRYDGLLYRENSRLLYDIYETLDFEFPNDFLGTKYKVENLDDTVPSYTGGATMYVIETGTVWQYVNDTWEDTHKNKREVFKTKDTLKGKWAKLDPQKPYLAPNYADKYLDYILEGTGWKVGEVDKIYIDNGTVELAEDGVVNPKKVELSTYLYFDNSNAYNAISELCNAFKCYPRFDHVNKIVNLKSVPGEDNGLTYLYRDNLKSSRITQDGEKAVSKLWVYGGEDLNGQVYIQDCNRVNPEYYLADYNSLDDLNARVTNPREGQYAKISLKKYTWDQLIEKTKKDGKRLPITNTFLVGELPVSSWGTGAIPEINGLDQLPVTGELGQTVFVREQDSYYSWIPEANAWFDTYLSSEPSETSDIITFERRFDRENDQWVDKGQFYHWWEVLSPYADNYIMDFSYFLDRKLMTEEQVNDIKYNFILPISHLNKKRAPLLKEYSTLSQELLNWNNTYDESKIAAEAIDKSLRTTYAIYETKDGITSLKDSGILRYPPGADFKTEGWSLAEVQYSKSDAVEVPTFDKISEAFPNPKIGNMVKVKDTGEVYWYANTYSFKDTISYYLGWNEGDLKDSKADAEKREKEWLYSPDGSLEARNRGTGLFEELREQELYPKTDYDTASDALKYWFNPPANIDMIPDGMPGDPKETSLAHNYYNARNRLITEEINKQYALEKIAEVETAITLLLERVKILENKITSLEHGLREKYGDYIVEGVFTDDTMVYIYNLWYAGLKALNLYHRPLITYELGVVDVSGLPEYSTMTEDVYHDIVYRLNKPELVLPNPGDYCYVTDNKLGIVKEKANITSVVRSLSNPANHQITIETVDTNTEELIGKLVTAANTIYSKEQIYNRSAVIKSDGTIAQDTVSASLDDNSGKLTIMSNNGTVLLGENGIITTDRENADLRMQYTGKGIFSSTNGGTTWENILNAGKISIKALSAGTIDSNTISVSNIGKTANIIIDGKGITAISKDGVDASAPNIIPDDKTSFFLDAKSGNAYFAGRIKAKSGDIGGWDISGTALKKGGVGMSSDNSSLNNYAFWAGNTDPSQAKFWVKHDGTMKATKATIEGDLTATTGKIGNWTINNGAITNNNVQLTSNGNLIASNVDIKGKIEASSGTVGGWNINNVQFQKQIGNYSFEIRSDRGASEPALLVYKNKGSNQGYKFYVRPDGYLYAANVGLSGSISSSTITGSSITCGTVFNLKTNGHFKYYNGVGFLTCGQASGTDHPWLSAVNVNYSNGISFRDGTTWGNPGDEIDSIRHSGYSLCITSGGNMNLEATNLNLVPRSEYVACNKCYFRADASNNSWIYFSTNGGYGSRIKGNGNSIYLYASSNGAVYCGGSGSSDKVATKSGGPSSLNVKRNLLNINNQYEDIYKDLQNLNMYTYDYRFNNIDIEKRSNYGFIIDEIEKTKTLSKYFKSYEVDRWIDENNNLISQEEADINKYKSIKVKEWERDSYIKGMFILIKTLQNKIDILEKQIKKESD